MKPSCLRLWRVGLLAFVLPALVIGILAAQASTSVQAQGDGPPDTVAVTQERTSAIPTDTPIPTLAPTTRLAPTPTRPPAPTATPSPSLTTMPTSTATPTPI